MTTHQPALPTMEPPRVAPPRLPELGTATYQEYVARAVALAASYWRRCHEGAREGDDD